jgi:hypothetical protein
MLEHRFAYELVFLLQAAESYFLFEDAPLGWIVHSTIKKKHHINASQAITNTTVLRNTYCFVRILQLSSLSLVFLLRDFQPTLVKVPLLHG